MSTFTITPLPTTGARPSGRIECLHPQLWTRPSPFATCPDCGEFAPCHIPPEMMDALAEEYVWSEDAEDMAAEAATRGEEVGREEGDKEGWDRAIERVEEELESILSDLRDALADDDADQDVIWRDVVEFAVNALTAETVAWDIR